MDKAGRMLSEYVTAKALREAEAATILERENYIDNVRNEINGHINATNSDYEYTKEFGYVNVIWRGWDLGERAVLTVTINYPTRNGIRYDPDVLIVTNEEQFFVGKGKNKRALNFIETVGKLATDIERDVASRVFYFNTISRSDDFVVNTTPRHDYKPQLLGTSDCGTLAMITKASTKTRPHGLDRLDSDDWLSS